jgi:phosphate transport system permease protein
VSREDLAQQEGLLTGAPGRSVNPDRRGAPGGVVGTSPTPPRRPPLQLRTGRERWADELRRRWFRYATGALATSVILTALVILWELWDGSRPAWSEWGLSFVWRTEWNPVTGQFGALPFVVGTLLTSAMALAIALPVSLGIAILLTEYAPRRLKDPLIFVVELLAAVPSVVFGLWGIFVLAPLVQRHVIPFLAGTPLGLLPIFGEPGSGYTLLTASLILAIMIIPIIASLSREVLMAVPRDQKEGALALGCTRWESMRYVVLSYGRAGIFSAAVLGLGRALGETMATTMTIGNRLGLTFDYFEAGNSMTAIIANELREAASEIHVASLVAIGLILFVLSFVLNTLGRLIIMRVHTRDT